MAPKLGDVIIFTLKVKSIRVDMATGEVDYSGTY